MGDLLHLRDAHEQAQMLLPWHVNGTLEPGEEALFEAHLVECAECRADVAANLALRDRYAALPVEVAAARSPLAERGVVPILRRRVTLGWALAGQVAVAAAAAVTLFVAMAPDAPREDYRLLGSEEAAAQSANVIVLFSPDTAERDMRAALEEAGARLVDGPTASGAYLARVANGARPAALNRLRSARAVVLAEPIDAGSAP